MSHELNAWESAARLVSRWLSSGERVDQLMESLPRGLGSAERARCQYLVFGVVRHAARIEAALGRLIAHTPRGTTRAALFLAGFELLDQPSSAPVIVHHAVEQAKRLASPAEARLVNAVMRKLAKAITAETAPGPLATAATLSEYYSHPLWLVRRWLALFGAEKTRALLEWNMTPGVAYARVRGGPGRLGEPTLPSETFKSTSWPGFFEIHPGHWGEVEKLLEDRVIYVQDPSTRIAVDLLAPQAGEEILDLCASPGGKALIMADRMGRGKIVAVDLPGPRLDRLRENLAGAGAVEAVGLGADVLRDLSVVARREKLPRGFSAVLLDVPCSNTGVMRHRIDVKWRLQEGDFRGHNRQQVALLASAGNYVAPGGRLVYSTCSIDPEENERVVETYLERVRGIFELEEKSVFTPWSEGHDGGAAFRLRRLPVTAPDPPPGESPSAPGSR